VQWLGYPQACGKSLGSAEQCAPSEASSPDGLDDPAAHAPAAAGLEVRLSAVFAWTDDPGADLVTLVDTAMAQLEAELPLA
jgi:hypothetical protein